ncbi:MAG: glycosyltransferase [Thermoleophilaceae bacterium]
MAPERFSIAQVTPYAWELSHEVNRFVERLSGELRARGHRVVVVAPSSSRTLVRASRATVSRLAGDPEALWREERAGGVLGVGQVVSPRGHRGGAVALPLDVSKTIEELLETAELDFVHVHEPFAPSAASAALRHSRALNVGTFHSTTERALSTQMARRIVKLLFGRLDGRTASFEATRALVESFFPGDYRVVHPGADLLEPHAGRDDAVELLHVATEGRQALRLFLRALRRLPPEGPWRATVLYPNGPADSAGTLPRALRERVRLVSGSEEEHLPRAHVAVMASSGAAPASQLPLRLMAAGAVPVASRLPQYEEALDHGRRGPLFEPGDVETLSAHLARLVGDPELRGRYAREVAAARPELSWSRVADEFEALYEELAARRHAPRDGAVRRRLASRPTIEVDLHMHTDHSPDCATPVDVLLDTARARGLGAIAVTDHNEISGALEARERTSDALKVIVAEEVKTARQGEVIGLFIEEKIARGMSLEETIAEIHRQGGLAYVPHPFDRMHTVPDYEHLLGVVEEIDAIEVFNPRVAFSAFNDEAARFAAKYRIAAGAGSDSHVAQGLGSVRIVMRDFDGPEEFLASLRDADIVRRRQSLLYVQALKFLQTKAWPSGAGRAGVAHREGNS